MNKIYSTDYGDFSIISKTRAVRAGRVASIYRVYDNTADKYYGAFTKITQLGERVTNSDLIEYAIKSKNSPM